MGALAVDGWAVTFGTAMRGLVGAAAGPRPHRRTKCNSPPVNGHCTKAFTYLYTSLEAGKWRS